MSASMPITCLLSNETIKHIKQPYHLVASLFQFLVTWSPPIAEYVTNGQGAN